MVVHPRILLQAGVVAFIIGLVPERQVIRHPGKALVPTRIGRKIDRPLAITIGFDIVFERAFQDAIFDLVSSSELRGIDFLQIGKNDGAGGGKAIAARKAVIADFIGIIIDAQRAGVNRRFLQRHRPIFIDQRFNLCACIGVCGDCCTQQQCGDEQFAHEKTSRIVDCL